MPGKPTSEEKDATNFLLADFNKGIDLIQHYDKVGVGILKFTFGMYAAIIGAVITLLKLDSNLLNKHNVIGDFEKWTSTLLFISVFIGWVLEAMFIRNRCYFVLSARYVNEIRRHFISGNEIGFKNESKMYDDPTHPKYCNPWGSSSWADKSPQQGLGGYPLFSQTVRFFGPMPSLWEVVSRPPAPRGSPSENRRVL